MSSYPATASSSACDTAFAQLLQPIAPKAGRPSLKTRSKRVRNEKCAELQHRILLPRATGSEQNRFRATVFAATRGDRHAEAVVKRWTPLWPVTVFECAVEYDGRFFSATPADECGRTRGTDRSSSDRREGSVLVPGQYPDFHPLSHPCYPGPYRAYLYWYTRSFVGCFLVDEYHDSTRTWLLRTLMSSYRYLKAYIS